MNEPHEDEERTARGAAETHWARALAVAAGVMLLSGVVFVPANLLIQSRYPDRPKPPDLLFDLLPHWPSWALVVEAIYVAGAVLLGVYVLRHAVRRIPEIIAIYGLMELGRALIIALTPLAVPYDEFTHIGIEGIRNWGEFPSGHTATFLLYYLLVDERVSPRIKRALAFMLVVEIVALLVSHSHYSIDIVGGLFLGYWVYHEYYDGRSLNWLKPWLEV